MSDGAHLAFANPPQQSGVFRANVVSRPALEPALVRGVHVGLSQQVQNGVGGPTGVVRGVHGVRRVLRKKSKSSWKSSCRSSRLGARGCASIQSALVSAPPRIAACSAIIARNAASSGITESSSSSSSPVSRYVHMYPPTRTRPRRSARRRTSPRGGRALDLDDVARQVERRAARLLRQRFRQAARLLVRDDARALHEPLERRRAQRPDAARRQDDERRRGFRSTTHGAARKARREPRAAESRASPRASPARWCRGAPRARKGTGSSP